MKRNQLKRYKLEPVLAAILLLINTQVRGQGKPAVFNQCGGDLTLKPTDKYGILTTPGFPTREKPNSRYEPNLDCTWTTKGDKKTLIVLKIWQLSIQPGPGNSNLSCIYDYVTIAIESIKAQKFCGTVAPPVIRGLGKLEVHFHSDNRVNWGGVQITFQVYPNFDPCTKRPCGSGTCEFNKVTLEPDCTCPPGITGKRCETDINECESEPCQNGGTCDQSGLTNDYHCACSGGWTGKNCEEEKQSPCLSNPCQHGGTCSELNLETAECACLEGYKGDMCEEKTGCGNPGIPYLKEFRRFKFGTRLKFSCIEEYIMKGAEVLACLPSGEWSKKMPDCKLNATEDNGPSPWSKAMAVIGTLFTINFVVFVTWMVYRSPWPIYESLRDFVDTKILKRKLEHPDRTPTVSTVSVRTLSDDEY